MLTMYWKLNVEWPELVEAKWIPPIAPQGDEAVTPPTIFSPQISSFKVTTIMIMPIGRSAAVDENYRKGSVGRQSAGY